MASTNGAGPLAGAGWKLEQPALELRPMWGAGATGKSLTCHAMALPPSPLLKISVYSVLDLKSSILWVVLLILQTCILL